MYKKGLFHDWVPRPVQLLLLFLFIIPLLTISGSYGSNINEMVGGLGILSEDLSMANYASIIGMVVTFPLILRLKHAFKSSQLLLFSFISLAFLSYVCSTTENATIMIAASLLLGSVKMIGTAEVIIPIMFVISPQGDRAKFYSVFYPLTIVMNMLSGYLTASISYDYNWQHVYAMVIPVLLFCILLVILFCHNSYGAKPVPLYQFDWLSLAVLTITLMLLNYVFTYARMLNWFDSGRIQGALIGAVVLLPLFLFRQSALKRPYLPLAAFGKKNVYLSLLLIVLMGIFSSTGSIQATFTGRILRYSSMTNALLNLTIGAGAVVGGFFSFFWLRNKLGIKGLIFTGFAAFIVHHIILYFLFSPVIEMQDMLLPSILKGFGLILLYISLGLYAAQKLGIFQFLSTVPIQILLRSFIGPAFWGSMYSYQLYGGQMKHTAAMVQGMEGNDFFFNSRLNPAIQGAIAQGQSVEVAQTLGVQGVWGAVQTQATLAASKEIFGWVILAGFVVLLFVLILRFGPINLRPWVKLRKRLRQNEIDKEGQEMLAAIAP